MGKFSRNSEYTFVDYEEIVANAVEHFDEGDNINIVVTWEECSKFLTACISTGKFIPYDITYAYPEINGYTKEYQIALIHSNGDNLIFVEPEWNEVNNQYLDGAVESNDVVFISMNVSQELYTKYINDGYRTVLCKLKNNR